MNFLGYGVDPGTPSWGYLITNQGREHMFDAAQLCIVPGVAITILVFASNMFGDAIRDILDPRLKGGGGSYNSKKLKRMLDRLAFGNVSILGPMGEKFIALKEETEEEEKEGRNQTESTEPTEPNEIKTKEEMK